MPGEDGELHRCVHVFVGDPETADGCRCRVADAATRPCARRVGVVRRTRLAESPRRAGPEQPQQAAFRFRRRARPTVFDRLTVYAARPENQTTPRAAPCDTPNQSTSCSPSRKLLPQMSSSCPYFSISESFSGCSCLGHRSDTLDAEHSPSSRRSCDSGMRRLAQCQRQKRCTTSVPGSAAGVAPGASHREARTLINRARALRLPLARERWTCHHGGADPVSGASAAASAGTRTRQRHAAQQVAGTPDFRCGGYRADRHG